MRYCGQCGSSNTESARFCTHCGAKLSEPVVQTEAAQEVQNVNEGVNDHTMEAVNIDLDGNVTREPISGQAIDPDKTASTDPVSAAILASSPEQGSAVQSAPQAQEQTQAQAPSDNKNAGTVTALSIIGFICAFLIPIAGLILGIIDLCMNDGRKKGLSIAAVVISACFVGIFIVTMLTVVIPLSAMFGAM